MKIQIDALRIFVFLLLIVTYKHAVSAEEREMNWEPYTIKDELTGKSESGLLLYRKTIPGTANGSLEIIAKCSVLEVNLANVTKISGVDLKLTFYNSPDRLEERTTPVSRVLMRNGDIGSLPSSFNRSTQYSNVYFGSVFEGAEPDDGKLPRKQEFTFRNGKKIIVEYNDNFYNFEKKCFQLREYRRSNPSTKRNEYSRISSYADTVGACIQSGVAFSAPPRGPVNPTVVYIVKFVENGSIKDIRLRKSSGNSDFDLAVENGIKNCNPFPKPNTGGYPADGIEISYQMYR